MQKPPVSNEQLLRTVLALLGVIVAVVATVSAAQQSDSGSSNPASESRRDGYVDPDFETMQKLEEIRQDFFTAVGQLRIDDALSPVSIDLELQRLAQQHAEGNAVTAQQPRIEHDGNEPREDTHTAIGAEEGRIAQVSASMPLETASGYAFLDMIIRSQKHMDVLLNPAHRHVGVGVAYGKERVWVVVAFSK